MDGRPGRARLGATRSAVRGRLLAAAQTVARQRGLGDAGMRDIAREAGVALGTLYNYFPDRDALLLAVVDESLRASGAALLQLPSQAGGAPTADALVPALVAVSDALRELVPALASALASRDFRERLHERLGEPEHSAAGRRAIAAFLRAEQRAGAVRPDVDVDDAAAVLLAVCHHDAFVGQLFGDAPPPQGPSLDRQLRLVIDGLTAS